MPPAPLLALITEERGVDSPRAQLRHVSINRRCEDESVCMLGDKAASHLGLGSWHDPTTTWRAVTNLGVEKMTWAEGKEYFRTGTSPTTLEVVPALAVVIQFHDRIVGGKPAQIGGGTKNRPTMGEQGICGLRQ